MIEKEQVKCGDIELVQFLQRGAGGSKRKFFVESIEDLDKILSLPYVPPQPDTSRYWKEREELGDQGLMMLDLGDPLEVLYHTMSAEDFSIFSLTEYEKIVEFTDVMYERVSRFYKYFLDKNIGEVFFIVGAEFAGPPLVSPDKFNEISARYVKGLVDLVRSYGKWSIVHYHGNLYKVLAGMKETGMDGLHTIESPPIGDCTVSQARRILGKDTILIGNIQYDDLRHRSGDEIRDQVRQVIEEGRDGKFILSPTAGPYEETIDEKTVSNYLAFIDAGIEYGSLS
jgi:uroporphyrinogen-III decarboxylase